MLAYIEGEIKAKGVNFLIVLTQGGLGYSIYVPPRVIQGKKIALFVYHYQTEKSDALYGFTTFEERELFARLLKVSGLGPKGALGLLSLYEPKELLKIIEEKDINKMKIAPGIGPKTARKILTELTGALDFEIEGEDLVREALMSLGFSAKEATEGVRFLDGSERSLEEKITKILKEKGKNV